MKRVKLLTEFGFWSIVIIGLIAANTPYRILGIVNDWRERHNKPSIVF